MFICAKITATFTDGVFGRQQCRRRHRPLAGTPACVPCDEFGIELRLCDGVIGDRSIEHGNGQLQPVDQLLRSSMGGARVSELAVEIGQLAPGLMDRNGVVEWHHSPRKLLHGFDAIK
jgi:hypothetical protein